MVTQNTRTETVVAKLWGVHLKTVATHRQRKTLVPAGQNPRPRSSYFYSVDTLHEFHCARAEGLHVPVPTIASLESGEDKLLTPNAVGMQLGLKTNAVYHLIEMGDLGKIVINAGHTLRVPLSEVRYYEQLVADSISSDEAAMLFCVSADPMLTLLRAYKLEEVDLRGQGFAKFVKRRDLYQLLKRFLHGPATVEDWYRWTMQEQVKMLSVEDAAKHAGLHIQTIAKHIAEGELAALHTGEKDFWKIPLPEVERLMSLLKPWTAKQLAQLFSVGMWTAERWWTSRSLCGRYHEVHQHGTYPNYRCIKQFVANQLTMPNRSAAAWLNARWRDPFPLIPVSEIPDTVWAVTPEAINEGLERGILDGISLPRASGASDVFVTQASVDMFVRWRDHEYSLVAQQSRR